MKKLFCILLSSVIIAVSAASFHAADIPAVEAEAFVLYCADNGEVLLSQNSDKELPIASITKIMTTLLTLEAAEKDNRVVEFTDEMVAEGSSMYLKIGEKVRLYDLAVGMMMQSGNDAANAAAIAVGGGTEAFSDLMNKKAREIGMEHTHFVTPGGLDDPEHYSCAYDMALLMAYALKNEEFAAITAQTSMEVHFVYPADKFVTYPNHNKLLRLYDGCIGGKTGYTDASGRTLVTAAKRDGMTLIAVTLNDHNDWNDHTALYDYGFASYRAVDLAADFPNEIGVAGSDRDKIGIVAEKTALIAPKAGSEIKVQIKLPPFLYAPVKKGDTVGTAVYTLDDETLAQVPLKAAESSAYNDTKRSLIQYIKDLLNWHS